MFVAIGYKLTIINTTSNPLNTIISTITTRRTHIGFDDTGTELATSVRKMAYESNKVIPKETLSPESTGRRNTNGFIKENNSVGKY
jgi:hypothetical protein